MNPCPPKSILRRAGWLALLLVLGGPPAVPAANAQQSGRFLLIFETTPAMKKNLPELRQMLGRLFASNLQNEMQPDDDLAVWTVDEKLHTGTFPLASWSPSDAEMYTDRLDDFLAGENFTRHADLAAIQPLLNRVVKGSDRLTILIFCDSHSRLLGTPYDSGVNDTITNTAAHAKNGPIPLILVLRAYHGQYLGCSVNRTASLSIPNFPAPKPEPPPVTNKVVVIAPIPPVQAAPAVPVPPPPAPKPVVSPVAALVIVGTNVSTNLPSPAPAVTLVASNPAPVVASPVAVPAPVAATPVPPLANPIPTAPAPAAVVVPPAKPVSNAVTAFAPVIPPAAPAAPATNLPEPPVAPPHAIAPASAPAASHPVPENPAGTKHLVAIAAGAGGLALIGIIVALSSRARRPRGSLITNSMMDDPRRPR